MLKLVAVIARYEAKDFVVASLDAQLSTCSALVSLKSDSLLDAEDIRPSLGDHRHPARLVQAVWSPIHHTLQFECEGDRQILRLSKRVAAFIFRSATTGAPIRSLVQSLRDAAPAAESFVYQISDGFLTGRTVCADLNLSHRADPILSRG